MFGLAGHHTRERVLTPFFLARVNLLGQVANENGPMLERKKELVQIGPLGQEKAS